MTITAEPLTEPVTYHGEGAVWSDAWGGLRCVDMLNGEVLDIGETGSVVRHKLGTVTAMIRPCTDGRTVVAMERSIALWDEERDVLSPLTGTLLEEGARFNEGGCTPDGTLLIGSLSYDFRPGGGRLFALERDGTASVRLPQVTVSNGIGFSPDGSRAYYVDSAGGTVAEYLVSDSGDWNEGQVLAVIDPSDGSPDGLWVDEEGGVWVAIYGGSAVRRYRPDGTLDEVVQVPARQVTSCTIGGADMRQLFITTSREGLLDGDDPQAGSIFQADIGVRGLPVLPFGRATTMERSA